MNNEVVLLNSFKIRLYLLKFENDGIKQKYESFIWEWVLEFLVVQKVLNLTNFLKAHCSYHIKTSYFLINWIITQ